MSTEVGLRAVSLILMFEDDLWTTADGDSTAAEFLSKDVSSFASFFFS